MFAQWIVDFARLMILQSLVSASRQFWSYSDLNNAIRNNEGVTLVALFTDDKASLIELYHKASLQVTKSSFLSDVKFFHIITDTAIGNKWELSELGAKSGRTWKCPLIILKRPKWLISPLEEPIVLYPIESKEDIGRWVHRKAYGTIGWITLESSWEDVKSPRIVVFYDFDFIQRPSFSHLWRNRIILASRKHPLLNFGIANSIEFKNKLKRFGIKIPRRSDSPIFIAADMFGSIFVMRDEFSEQNLEKFIHQFSSGLIAPISDSFNQPSKTGNQVALHREITGNSFPKFVTHSSKDILIKFIDQKCKYTEELDAYWNELARELLGEPNLELVSLDGSVNTIPSQFKVKQLPSVYLIPSQTKDIIKYNGGKSLHDLIKFVAKHSSNELNNFQRDGSRRLRKIEGNLKTEL